MLTLMRSSQSSTVAAGAVPFWPDAASARPVHRPAPANRPGGQAHGWFAAEGRDKIVFDTPAAVRWTAAWKAEGVDPSLLANTTGSA